MRAIDIRKLKRREFLRLLGGITAAPLMGPLSELAYGAGPFTDYRALVCVFLFGGNDAHNMIVPLDATRFASYAANRGPLALPQSSLAANAVTDAVQGSFGLHPRMTQTRGLFNSGKLAVVSNVGILLRPTTKADYVSKTQLPPQLFSHSDMQGHWQTLHPQAPVTDGWGGRLADLVQSANTGQLSVSVSTAGSGVFLKGNSAVAHTIGTYSPTTAPPPALPAPIVQRIRAWRDWDVNNANPQNVYANSITMVRANKLEDQFGDVATRSVDINDFILNAVYNGPNVNGYYPERIPINTAFPTGNSLAAQLRSVAMMIAARAALGIKRQIFFVSAGGGFDNHSDQFDSSNSVLKPPVGAPLILYGKHADLLGQVDAALKAFYDATVELGVQNSVTTFTASDFGRTLTSNGKGSDHGWGSHHLVMGGATHGGKIYGTFQNLQVGAGNPQDAGQGRLIPTFGVDQYAATMAKWMGATPGDLNAVFPNLVNFGAATDLGFLA
jgi:uncharacterized protein (DUF1501 family)